MYDTKSDSHAGGKLDVWNPRRSGFARRDKVKLIVQEHSL
jgi:hypothetical protein